MFCPALVVRTRLLPLQQPDEPQNDTKRCECKMIEFEYVELAGRDDFKRHQGGSTWDQTL